MKEAILLTDGYKLDHRRQYPENTEYVYSNWTPRSCHYYPEATEGAVVFGIQYFIKEYLMKQFQIVSDTWDFWKVMTEYLPKLKDEILARDGRLVITLVELSMRRATFEDGKLVKEWSLRQIRDNVNNSIVLED